MDYLGKKEENWFKGNMQKRIKKRGQAALRTNI